MEDFRVYLVGFFISYLLWKSLRKRMSLNHDWETIAGTFLGGLCSWFGVIIALFVYMVIGIALLGKKNFKIRPPKWL